MFLLSARLLMELFLLWIAIQVIGLTEDDENNADDDDAHNEE